jgi:hypothetical protein
MTSHFAPHRPELSPVPAHLLGAWEAVYRDYVSTSDRLDLKNVQDRRVLAQLSVGVAATWRRLAEAPGVAWWLMAAFSTAAEAMEQQARDWDASWPDVAVPEGTPPRHDVDAPAGRRFPVAGKSTA